ncbi:MAG: SDR family NAD(P)-dependent oxidoreductase [Lachnospiraceae bacterium]|nr:SDR family NAD(P)-dependent oxidoreductase [Lachnospiraceae bacterium]
MGIYMNNRKTALITGASRGIGAAIAKLLAENGYHLVLTCDKSISALVKLSEQIMEEYSVSCTPLQADMSKEEDVLQIFEHIKNLDVVVNNAGISHVGLLSDMTSQEWHRVLGVNLDSCFYTSRAAIPLMLNKHEGHIINISSVWGNVGASMEVAYSASKGGMNAFTKALAKELAPSGIRVNAIACGVIDTQMNACFTEEDMAILKSEIPADRLGSPMEVAQLVLQLITGPAYLTGQVITLDGGWI